MPPPNPPRRKPADDDDFEVVDDDPKPPPKSAARPLPPLPGQAAPKPAAKAAAPAAKPAAKPAPKPPPKPAFEVVDDTEVEVTAKSKTAEVRKPARAARDDDEDDRPRRRPRDDDDDDDDRPRKKKKAKKSRAKTGEEYADEVREQRLKEFEIIWPAVFLVLGIGMTVTGAIGAGGAAGTLSVVLVIGGLIVSIPVTIVTLMVVGVACGINYGRFGPAVLKLAAITFVVNGVFFLCDWFKVYDAIAVGIGGAVSFGMFKMMFGLDNGETNISMGAINVVSFLLKWLVIILVAVILTKMGRNPDDDGPSTNTKWKGGGQQAPPGLFPTDPDDDGDPDDDEP